MTCKGKESDKEYIRERETDRERERERERERLIVKSLSCVQLFTTPWAVDSLASLFMGFSRQEYWNGFPFPSPGDLPDQMIKP